MDAHIYPNEPTWRKQGETGDRWQPRPIIEQLKPLARQAGLWKERKYCWSMTSILPARR